MDKKTTTIVGVGVLAVAGYLYWKSTQPKTEVAKFVGANGRRKKMVGLIKQNAVAQNSTFSPRPSLDNKRFANGGRKKQASGAVANRFFSVTDSPFSWK
jgi:hypothetical protein